MARGFLTFHGWLLQRGELPLRLRELAVLRVALTRRSVFFWGEHARVATEGGVPEDDIARLAEGNDGFDGTDRLVLEPPTSCSVTAAPAKRRGNASPTNSARTGRWNSSSSSAPT